MGFQKASYIVVFIVLGFFGVAIAANKYGDQGIVLTALPASIVENYKNIISVNTTPGQIANYKGKFPGFKLGFLMRRPLSCGVDYDRNQVYAYDYHIRGLLMLENWNSSAIIEAINITTQHYGISREYVKIAVDWVSHNVYWTDPLMNWIAMQPGGVVPDPSLYKVVVSGDLVLPRGLALDPINNRLFWSDYRKQARIESSDLLGNGRTQVVIRGLVEPQAITCDIRNKIIYWVDRASIDSCSYDGSQRKHVLTESRANFFDVALFEGVLVVTDIASYNAGGDGIVRFYHAVNGSVATQPLAGQTEAPFGVCIYSSTAQPQPNVRDLCSKAGCSDICVHMDGRAQCTCRDGYKLSTDSKTCMEDTGKYLRGIAINTGRDLCIVDIRVVSSLATYTPFCFYSLPDSEVQPISQMELNMMDRYVYFVVGRFLYSVPIHGSEKQRRYMILESSYDITTISYDYVDQLLYYAVDSGSPQIWTVEPNEPQHVNIMHQSMTGSGPHNLVIVPHIHKGFWLSDGNHLEVMDLETKDSVINHVTLQYEFVNPKKLVHDVKYDLLFALVASSIGHTNLLSVNYNGSASDFLYNEKDIETFALYNELIILVHKNVGDHVIRSADIGLGSPLKEIEQGKITGIQTIKDIKVLDQKALQPFEKSQCSRVSNGGCEQICLPNYLSKTPTCECFIGYKKMSNGTCVAAPVEDNFILVTDYTYNQVFQISMDNPNTVVTVPLPNLGRPDGILYNHQTNKVLWTTAGTANIWASSLNGSFQNTFADISALFVRPDRIALDPSTGNVYYTGVSQVADFLFDSVIGVVNGNGSHAVVVWEGHMPRDIVLDAGEGLMFWTDHGDRMTGVYRAQMDGSNKRSLVLDDVVWPNGVTLDYRAKRVYWTDGSLDRIYSCDYDGAERKLVRQFDNSSHLMDIQLVEDFLYFTDINMRQVQRIHKDGQGPILRVGPADLGNIQSIFYFNAAYADKTPKNEPCMVNNGGCSEFCFPAPGGKHTCGCNWIHNLLADGKTCENVPRCPSVFSNTVVLEDSTCIRVSGNTCAFNCTGIYKARADVTRLTCTDVIDSDGALTWDTQYPCEMIRCPLFIPDGFVNTSCYPLPGSTCTFTCKDGYHPNPLVDHIICDMSGRWNYSAGESTLCIPHHSPHVEQEMAVVHASTGSRNMAIGLGVGVGILLLVLVVILVVISLYRLGKLGTLFGKKTPRTTSFENPRYSENNVDLQPVDGAEVSNGFHYSTLNDDKVDLTQDSRSKQHQQKQQQQSTSSINGTFGNSSA